MRVDPVTLAGEHVWLVPLTIGDGSRRQSYRSRADARDRDAVVDRENRAYFAGVTTTRPVRPPRLE